MITDRRPGEGDLDELIRTVCAGGLSLDLRAAAPTGPWRSVARVQLGATLSPAAERALTFTSDNAGGGIVPNGFVNRVRGAAYAASHRGRQTA